MSKSVVAVALTLIALAFVPAEALAYPISVSEAQRCTHWQGGFPSGTITCAYCEFRGRRSVCHWIACDATGCEQVDIAERKMPPTRLRGRPTP
jgi:hypothetical protein